MTPRPIRILAAVLSPLLVVPALLVPGAVACIVISGCAAARPSTAPVSIEIAPVAKESPALDPGSAESVRAHLTVAEGLRGHEDEIAAAVVRAHEIVQSFARSHGWDEPAAATLFEQVEVFDTQDALWRRILALNAMPLDTPLPTPGLAAALESRVLVAVRAEEYSRIQPEYAARRESWARLLAHELVHRLHVEILRGNQDAMGPSWFFEGLAVVGSGQDFDEGLEYSTAADALRGVSDRESPLAYRRFAAAVRFFSRQRPLPVLVEKAGHADFESFLATLPDR